ncbi:hypothetical protein [Noviherbaspirillum galbum]|uniref:Type IV pilus biogenesis protein PilP n=1 Tax=Noviherbaspirillum galbum TaxID=2709383 RepID=A0A6B3SS75_9BURK|nr:hypothetical protein [Noviherbaspirillum galbum]NEX63368.1 hypothetical protein [Noviherbaspirillum galbum]
MKKSKVLVLAALMAAVAVSSVARAESFSETMSNLDAQSAILKKRSEVNALRQQLAAGTTMTGLPRVVSAFGVENAMVAKLSMPDGSVRVFRENQWVSDSLKIVAITGGGVTVAIKNQKETIPLAFAVNAPGAAGMPGLPGAPMGANGAATVPEALLPPLPRLDMPRPTPAKP